MNKKFETRTVALNELVVNELVNTRELCLDHVEDMKNQMLEYGEETWQDMWQGCLLYTSPSPRD